MPKKSNVAQILALIKKARKPLTVNDAHPHDYETTKIQIMDLELKEELIALNSMMQHGNYANLFKARCKTRWLQNAHSCISYIAMPQGECNQLYLNIALITFNVTTIGELFSILLPTITTILTPLHQLERTHSSRKQSITIHFEKVPITRLDEEITLDALSSFVVWKHLLFDVRAIAYYNLGLHQVHHEAISQLYPELTNHLYQHNPALKSLLDHLLLVRNTPLKQIQTLIQQLRLGGTEVTGLNDASIDAELAFADFSRYLALLPKDAHSELLSLKPKDSSTTFRDIMEDIRSDNCIEIAADELELIIINEGNQSFLNAPQHLSKSEYSKIRQQYHKQLLPSGSNNPHYMLPAIYLEKVLPKIVINTEDDYTNLLLACPIKLYTDFIQQIQSRLSKSLPGILARMISNQLLNDEQREALDQAFIANITKLGGIPALFEFSLESRNTGLLISFFSNMTPEHRLFAAQEKNWHNSPTIGNTILHSTIAFPEIFQEILTLIPMNNRPQALQIENNVNKTVLEAATNDDRSMTIIRRLVPQPEDLRTLSLEKNEDTKRNNINHSFYFKSLIGLMAATGSSMLLVGILLSDPLIFGIGASLVVYGFFAMKSTTSAVKLNELPPSLEVGTRPV